MCGQTQLVSPRGIRGIPRLERESVVYTRVEVNHRANIVRRLLVGSLVYPEITQTRKEEAAHEIGCMKQAMTENEGREENRVLSLAKERAQKRSRKAKTG